MTLHEKLEIISALEEEHLSEELIEGVVDSLENPSEPAYVCTTPEELTEALTKMSQEND